MIRLPVALSVLLATGAGAERFVVDGIAAVVGRRVITLSEVETEGRIVLVSRAGQMGLEQPIDDAFRRSVLDYLLVQELLLQEARRAHGLTISEVEVDKGVVALAARFESPGRFRAFLEETGADEEIVRTIVRRDLTVRALLARVLEQTPAVPDEAVRRFLADNPGFMAGISDEVRQKVARETVEREERERRFARYVEELKQAAEIRIVASFAPAPPGSGDGVRPKLP